MKARAWIFTVFLTMVFSVFGVLPVRADVALWQWAFNVDGTLSEGGPGYQGVSSSPPGLDDSDFDWNTGLGSLEFTYSPGVADDYFFIAFFDHEIDENSDGGFTNEYGAASGTPGERPGNIGDQSWEIDEPGYLVSNPGDIYSHVLAGTLDISNGVPVNSPNDVSMAMGWDFSLAADQTAVITLELSDTAPTSGFYLSQMDSISRDSIYFSSTLDITSDYEPPEPIPEPATMLLLGTGLAGLMGLRKRRGKAV